MSQITSTPLSTSWPVTFARGRNGDVYGVNGEERGFRWDGVTADVEQLGISAPANAPTVTAAIGTAKLDVIGVEIIDGGSGYNKEEPITVTVSPTTSLKAKTSLSGGRCGGAPVLRYGRGYTSPPTCSIPAPTGSGGGSGATLTVATTSSTATLPGGATETRYAISSISVSAAGSGYKGRPTVSISGPGPGGAVAEAVVASDGTIASVRVIQPGVYTSAPTATVIADSAYEKRQATAEPTTRPGILGKYWCALRYIDDTSEANRGPIPSSISELTAVEFDAGEAGFDWSWVNTDIEARVDKIELWRTTADQALVLYKVATVNADVTTYVDSLSDAELSDPSRNGFAALPITLPNGQVNARRFTPPPQNKRSVVMFQDRAWYGVDVPGRTYDGSSDSSAAEPNALYFSEADEPEAVPEVNQIIIQDNVRGQDRVTALMPFGAAMVVFQERHSYRLSFVSQPLIDSNVTMIGNRGCLNQRCWDVFDSVAYVVDSSGMYVLDGSNSAPISDPVESFFSDNIIHWPSSKWFFVRVDPATRVARFFFSVEAGFPDRALCFHPVTKAWWLETYAQTFAGCELMHTGSRLSMLAGGQAGDIVSFDASNADLNAAGEATAIACQIRTGNMSLAPGEEDRAIRFLYAPTIADCTLSLGLHYNNSSTARNAAVATDRGSGFTTSGGSAATLNLSKARSALGDATGYAICHYSGRVTDRSAGGDRHLAANLSISRPTTESLTIYGIAIGGVAQ